MSGNAELLRRIEELEGTVSELRAAVDCIVGFLREDPADCSVGVVVVDQKGERVGWWPQ
jgi:hypothetical protein